MVGMEYVLYDLYLVTTLLSAKKKKLGHNARHS